MYNLGHLGLYKNIPKKRMFNSTPNYERDSYSLLQYKSHLRNEFLIPLKADGDGTGVATIYLQSTEDQAINITGAGRFYTNAQGTTGESTSAVVGTSLTTLYVKLNAGSCYLVLTKADKLFGLGSSSVNVITEADKLGNLTPLYMRWENGELYRIDKVIEVRQAVSKVGGNGLLYTVRIQGKERRLFYEINRWFIESYTP